MFEEARTRMSQNGRIVIPAAFRKALGVDDGDDLVLRLQDGELRITTLQRENSTSPGTGPPLCKAWFLSGRRTA